MSAPGLIKVTGLWRKTSQNGNDYFVGRLAGCKVLIFENRDRGEDEAEPTHHLFFSDASHRQAADSQPVPPAARRSVPRRRAYSNRGTVGAPASPGLMADDPVDDLYRFDEP